MKNITAVPGKPYKIGTLTALFLDAAAAFHAQTIARLPAQEKSFILPKSEDYFARHIEKGNGNIILALTDRDKIIAQSLILHPTQKAPATGMSTMPPTMPALPPAPKLSIMQAVAVHPDYRGQGLMNFMIAYWITHAARHARTALLAEIQVENAASWAGFLKGGLHLVSLAPDPQDGALLYNAHAETAAAQNRALSPGFNHYAGKIQTLCPPQDYARQAQLFKQGYAVTANDRARNALQLTKMN